MALIDNGLKAVNSIASIFKDTKGRFSSKRTVAGAIVAIIAIDVERLSELNWIHIVGFAISASIVVLAPIVESKEKASE